MDSTQAIILRNEVQGKRIGGWLIDGYYGNGKSAVVLPAEKDGTLGAIKIFHPELVERYGKRTQLERINREKTLVGASHPNLVKIFDGGECPNTGYLYVVMERIPYKNIHTALSEIPLSAIPKIISQIASAARFLEDRGLVHRDIKPENIAISNDFSRAILLDLGILLPIGISNLTDIDQRFFIGTLRYSSPEFLLRQEENTVEGWRAVTFYQIGAVLHDMLMKEVLFEKFSEPFSRLVEAVKNEKPNIYSEDTRSVSIANRCLVKNASTRLELVNWADFLEIEESEAESSIATRERIAQRQKYFSKTTHAPNSMATNGFVTRRTLDDLCNRFESRVAALLNNLQYFPLRATKSEKNLHLKKCIVIIRFEQDLDKGLPFYLTIMFEINLIDENNGSPIFKAAASACLSNIEIKPEQLYPATKFFVGELDSLLDCPSLEDQFLYFLEEAYRIGEEGKSPTGILPLQLEPRAQESK